jgi:integration host factor subunit alpha
VTKLDRFGRSTLELLRLIDQITKVGAFFKSLGDPLWDTSTAQGRLLSTLLAAIPVGGFIGVGGMAGKTVARDDLYEAVRRKLGLSAHESRLLVEQVLAEMTRCLVRGETVKLTGFGVFTLRKKRERVGRNPRTGVPATISARRIVAFKASAVLKRQINSSKRPTSTPGQ